MNFALLGWGLVHFSWQAPLVAAGLALCLRIAGPGARLRYGAACAAMIVLSFLPLLDALYLGLTYSPGTLGGDVPSAAGMSSVAPAAFAAVAKGADALAMAWLVLAAVLLVRWLGGWWMVSRLAGRGVHLAQTPWTTALTRIARRLRVRRPVRIFESDRVMVPTVVGVRRPTILIPRACSLLVPTDIEAILAHELGHVIRHDCLANLLQALADALLFFHPAVWWVSRTVRHEREISCDDVAVRAVGDARAYACALARLELLCADRTGLALAATGGSVLSRLERLTRPQAGVRPSRSVTALTVGGLVSLALLAGVGQALLPATLWALRPAPPPWYIVHASDPAGAFTVAVERGRVVRAVVGGDRVPIERIRQLGDSVVLPWSGGTFSIHLHPSGGFSWSAREP